MTSAFQETARHHQIALHRTRPDLFDHTPTGGRFLGKPRDFVLRDGAANLHPSIRADVLAYFAANRIQWWGGAGPSGHLLSSQIACLNHLYPLRNDALGAREALRRLDPGFVEALPVPCDTDSGYIAFEATSDVDRLTEGTVQRGANNTSLDAVMLGRRSNGQRVLVAIEWKYTEHYDDTDKSAQGPASAGAQPKGQVRRARYDHLIAASGQLRGDVPDDLYREPFYQLMRQTLLLEQLVEHRQTECLGTDEFLHVHAIPPDNAALLDKAYLPHGLGLEAHWNQVLADPARYRVIDAHDWLLGGDGAPIGGPAAAYLAARYWPTAPG